MSSQVPYQLKCRECQTAWGNQPVSFCQKCFAPLEVAYDWPQIREQINKDEIAKRGTTLWRYKELLPLPEQYDGSLPVGFTPLHPAWQTNSTASRFILKTIPSVFPHSALKIAWWPLP